MPSVALSCGGCFAGLKDKGVTALVPARRGNGSMTRYGLEECVADRIILLDHRVSQEICTRRLRVVKYRGSFDGTNAYPFLRRQGISILPITLMGSIIGHPRSGCRAARRAGT